MEKPHRNNRLLSCLDVCPGKEHAHDGAPVVKRAASTRIASLRVHRLPARSPRGWHIMCVVFLVLLTWHNCHFPSGRSTFGADCVLAVDALVGNRRLRLSTGGSLLAAGYPSRRPSNGVPLCGRQKFADVRVSQKLRLVIGGAQFGVAHRLASLL